MIRWRLWNKVRELFWLPPLAPRSGEAVPPHPRLDLMLNRTAPGALVRLLPAAGMVVIAMAVGTVGLLGWVLVAVAGAAITWRPRWPIAPSFALLTGLWVFAGGDLLTVSATGAVEGVWRVSVLVLAVHGLLAVAAFTCHVAWRSLVEVAVLGRVARSVLGAQAIAQTLVLLSAWLRAGLGGQSTQDWLRLLAVAAVVGVVLLAMPRHWLVRRARSSGQ